MNKNNTAVRRILPLTLASLGALGGLQPAAADILLYDKDETTFSTDGYFNAFYVNSDVDRQGETYDRRQSRVKMGFLPNYIGFNFGRKVDELSLGGRASFWVTINDSETDGTDTAIDVRQFYGTVSGDWGEVLIGKDFGLFSRSNIFLDELLANPLWLAVIGGSALLALLVLLMILSRRNAQKEKEEAQAFAADTGEEQEDALDLGKDGFDDLTLDEPEPQVAAVAPQVEKTTAQTSDALGEADIYIAYGRFNQAAELLQNAIYDEPQRTDLRLKLMEVYAEMGDREGFARQENELREIGGAQPQVEQLKSRYPAMVAVAAVAGLAGAKLVSAGQAVVTLARPEVREAVFDLPTEVAESLPADARFLVSAQLDPQARTTGSIRELGPQADASTRTRRVRLSLAQTPEAFRLGSTIQVQLSSAGSVRSVLPASVLLERDGKTQVWVVDGKQSSVALREVQVLSRDERQVVIGQGLADGDRVVRAGVNSLKPGQKIKLDEDAR